MDTWCEFKIEGICEGRAVVVHHKLMRSHGGGADTTADVCSACHRYTHMNPAESYATGRLIRGVK